MLLIKWKFNPGLNMHKTIWTVLIYYKKLASVDANATYLMPVYLYSTSVSLCTSCPTVKCLTEFKSVIKQFKLIHINAYGLF